MKKRGNLSFMKKFLAISATVFAFAAAAQAQDTSPPTISISSPVNGAIVEADRVTVTGDANDDVGIAEVQYRVEGRRKWRRATLTNPDEPSTQWVWSFKHKRRGKAVRFYVRARDEAGNESQTIGFRIFRARRDP